MILKVFTLLITQDIAVVGVPDPVYGQKVAAVLVLDSQNTDSLVLDLEALR